MHSFFAINRLSAYIDGELPDSEAAEVERAIAADPTVRDEYDRLLETIELLRTRGPMLAPPTLHAAILDRVAEEPDPVAGFWARLLAPFRAIPMEAVGVVFAVVAVVLLINKQPGVDAVPSPAPVATDQSVAPPPPPAEETAQQPPRLASRPDQPAPPQPEAGLPAKPFGASKGRAESTSGRGGSPPVTTVSDKREPSPKSASKKSASEPQQQKSAVPEEAYVAPWEQQGQDYTSSGDGDNRLVNVPYSYRLDPSDQHGLESLKRLAAKHGGSLKHPNGAAFAPHPLQEGQLVQVRADIPLDRVEDFVAALRQLGVLVPMASGDNGLHAGVAQVNIQVRFEP